MKRILPSLLCLLMMATSVFAQNGNQLLRQRMEQAKLMQIRQDLMLDEAQFAQFRPIYMRYERALANVDFRSQNRLLNVHADSLSNEEATALLQGQWEQAKRLLHIRERFYIELRSVLSPQQLVKLFQSEADIRQKAVRELGRRQRRGM